MKKIAPKGSSEAFIRAHLDLDICDCLFWPYRLTKAGYGVAVIGGVQKHAHTWMCTLAHGQNPSPKHIAAHSCGNRHCVNKNHLRWATDKENASDRYLHGTISYGERSGRTNLSEDDILAIRSAGPDLKALMDQYGVSKGCISKIRSGQRWPHI